MIWTRSSHCAAGECIEAADVAPGVIGIRHSHWPSMRLEFTREEWAAFAAGVKAGEFDHLAGQP